MRIGILGGTFDPIHNGHIRLARQAKKKLGLDRVVFVPANIPPHKIGVKRLPACERYKMVLLALKASSCFEASDYEIKKGGTSYSVKTLQAFRKKFGRTARLFFLAGSDSLGQLGSWKDIGQAARLADFVVFSRPGFKAVKIPGIKIVTISALDISSSDIRRRLKKGLGVKGFLPEPVWNYINKKGFYK